MCFFVLQMRGRTPNTLPGLDLQMERWPSGGRAYQVSQTHIMEFVLCDPFRPILSFPSLLVLLCWIPPAEPISTPMKITALKIERRVSWCFLSVWPAGSCLQSQFISSHLELVAYLQLESKCCNLNLPISLWEQVNIHRWHSWYSDGNPSRSQFLW